MSENQAHHQHKKKVADKNRPNDKRQQSKLSQRSSDTNILTPVQEGKKVSRGRSKAMRGYQQPNRRAESER